MTTLNDLARFDSDLANNPYFRGQNISSQSNNNSNNSRANNEQTNQCINPGNQWIIDLLQERSQRQTGHLQYHQNAYAKAIKNIKQCPYKITNEHNAKVVVGIGKSMAKLIKSKLLQRNEYIQEDETQAKLTAQREFQIAKQNKNIHKNKPAKNKQNANKRKNKSKNKNKKRRKTKEPYTPRIRSGGYALLLHMYDMYRNHNLQGFTKKQLIRDAQKYCEASFTDKKQTYYDAWKSMTQLENRSYVQRRNNGGREHEFRLTRAGQAIGEIFYAQFHGHPIPPLPDKSLFSEEAWPRGDDNDINNENENENDSDNKRKFKCEYCDKAYNTKGWLEKHMKKEHPKDNDKKQIDCNASGKKRSREDIMELDDEIELMPKRPKLNDMYDN
eukprot:191490_1